MYWREYETFKSESAGRLIRANLRKLNLIQVKKGHLFTMLVAAVLFVTVLSTAWTPQTSLAAMPMHLQATTTTKMTTTITLPSRTVTLTTTIIKTQTTKTTQSTLTQGTSIGTTTTAQTTKVPEFRAVAIVAFSAVAAALYVLRRRRS
jgi:hypothetical protein